MPTGCIRCGTEISELHSVCTDCAQELFSSNLFWMMSDALIHEPAIDRYMEDSKSYLRIGDHPGDEMVFKEDKKVLEEVKGYSVDEMGPQDYRRVEKRLNIIMAELGISTRYRPEDYLFSPSDVAVFSEVFYLLEDLEHKFSNREGVPELYNRVGNLFLYNLTKVDSSAFEMEFREEIVDDVFKEAEGYFELAIQSSEEEDPVIYHNKGKLYLEKERFDKAEGCFEKVIELEPENTGVELDLCESMNGQGELRRVCIRRTGGISHP